MHHGLTIFAVALGALCSSWLVSFVGGGWKHEDAGYVAWALMPYAVLAAVHLCARLVHMHSSVQRVLAWGVIAVSLAGPLLYIDPLFIHVDAQGALAMLMVPVMQAGGTLFVIIAALLWQWRVKRLATRITKQTVDKIRFQKLTAYLLAVSIIGGTLFYILIFILQYKDRNTIDTAKEVDFYITHYCKKNNRLPTSAHLHDRFPYLSTDIGWFYLTDDKTWLKLQYPVRWRNGNAIGTPKTSEFTATVYAYSVEYHCGNNK